MLISDRDIRILVAGGRVVLEPWGSTVVQLAPIDVCLDRYFCLLDNHKYAMIDLAEEQPGLTWLFDSGDKSLTLHLGEFVLGSTFEHVTLPGSVAARLEDKSSPGRLGLLTHSTAGFIDPGSTGHAILELSNITTTPIALHPGVKIGQLCFFQMSSPSEAPYGSGAKGSRYQGQHGPTASRSYLNFSRVEVPFGRGITEEQPMLSPSSPQDSLDLETASPFHLLVVGDDVLPEEIDILATRVWPQFNRAGLGLLELTSGVYLTGPWHLTPEAIVKFGLPLCLEFAYIISVPALQDKPVPQELWDRGPLWDAFREGGPEGLELEALNGTRRMMRRLTRASRFFTGPIIVSDPDSVVEMRVLSEVWLGPAICLQISQQVFPQAELELGNASDGDISSGRNQRLTIAAARATHDPDGLRTRAREGVSPDERARLHTEAGAFDEAAMSMPPVLDAYAISVDIIPMSAVHVIVSGETAIPPALGHREDGLISYDLRWITPNMALIEMNKPCRVYHLDRLKIIEAIENLAKPLAAVISGVIVDADEFVVPL